MKTQTSRMDRVIAGACLGLLLGAGGCVGDGPGEPPLLEHGWVAQESISVNGLSTNGLSTNGLSTNGLSTNGLSTNGLSTNGLSAPSFATWFNGNESVAYSDMVMKYVVACALPSGQTRTWTNPVTGTSHSWAGALGLATGWTQGRPVTVAEQQLLSACLAAHVNKFGVSVPISARGRDSAGVAIPVTSSEAATYSELEACFFGNLFSGEGLFAGSDRVLKKKESTTRACGLSSKSGGENTECPPILHMGACATVCTRDATRAFWKSCVVNGVTYLPITTHLRPQDIYSCGDGVCQFTESCGNANTYDSCSADCLACGTSPGGSRHR
ncbi:MAG: hypothetical protein EOO72_06730 [Myxococcaceae bacterium]|nr:MAG: hypothetical protein EOO72_06730 [Myxococcaceae bacterium]